MFAPLPEKFSFPEAEEQMLRFWEDNQVFEKSLTQRKDAEPFVFYEGPPTANGMPHPGHCLTRSIKDLFPRYQTMCGRFVERKAGWDTHGLPVEVEVCKELGIHTKQEIEAYGMEKFVRLCIDSVFRYVKQWEQMTRRLGFWVNLEDAYVTFHQSYVESVWWGLKQLFERGLLYQGHKVVWWWAQGGTALSAGEVGEGYRTVQDPSVYVRFPLLARFQAFRRGKEVEPRLGVLTPLPGSVLRSARPKYFAMSREEQHDYLWSLVAAAEETSKLLQDMPIDPARTEDEIAAREFLCNLCPFLAPTADGDEILRALVELRDRGREYFGKALSPASLLVWTTTPWTLVSNHFAAIHPELEYAFVYDPTLKECFYVASALVESLSQKLRHELEVLATGRGKQLIGWRYRPPFLDYFNRLADEAAAKSPDARDVPAWRIVPADFVELGTGTGIVHIAPAYGEVDFELLQSERQKFGDDPNCIPLLNAVGPDGLYTDEAPEAYRGRWVKDCDKDIIRELKERGILLHQETIEHEYPFCPRAEDDPLIQYARKSWFVRTSQFKDEFLKNNAGVKWLPDHIREGRFGDFLRNNVDWALSRERFWGTPLPIWKCSQCGKMEAIGSLPELQAKPDATDGGLWAEKKAADPTLPDHLMVHKPYIDAWTYRSPCCTGAKMERVPEVIDCWWDAGSMPFAQWGFPHQPGSVEHFAHRFPANFISEALDQTRGWFYGLLAISTLLFGEQRDQNQLPADIPNPLVGHPYQACIVLGLMLGEDGLKMSKRKKNYREPSYVFDAYGADAMRWFFFNGQTPWTSVRFEEQNIRDAQREFLVRLYNVFSFFNIYARIDGFVAHPQNGSPWRPTAERCELDRWIISELHRTTQFVREKLDGFENYPAAGRLNEFVDALSNWYVRRSRDRFWKSAKDQDKWDAYHTLFGVLITLSKLIAPFTPFFAEVMYQNLRGGTVEGDGDPAVDADLPESVHLCDYPIADATVINEGLAQEMDLVRQIVSQGRAARTAAKLKVRQPLALVEIILAKKEQAAALESHADLIAEELNIKRVELAADADQYVTYEVKPNFKALGPKFGKLAQQVGRALATVDPAQARATLDAGSELTVNVGGQLLRLNDDDVQVQLQAKPGWSAAQGRAGVVVVQTELTDELRAEGTVRELIHHVQNARKEQNLAYEARITLHLATDADLRAIVDRFKDTIQAECLVSAIEYDQDAVDNAPELKIEGHPCRLAIVVS